MDRLVLAVVSFCQLLAPKLHHWNYPISRLSDVKAIGAVYKDVQTCKRARRGSIEDPHWASSLSIFIGHLDWAFPLRIFIWHLHWASMRMLKDLQEADLRAFRAIHEVEIFSRSDLGSLVDDEVDEASAMLKQHAVCGKRLRCGKHWPFEIRTSNSELSKIF